MGRRFQTLAAAGLSLALALPAPATAWDYPGHRIVGAIADLVLQKYHPQTYQRVKALLEIELPSGLWQKRMLREVAVFPDCAKPDNEPYCGRPSSAEELAYAKRNPGNASFHYTDVPLQQPRYVAGSAGTEDTDVVHMIGYVVAQLHGDAPVPVKNVKLSDREALWLLAHLVGDIHQPLHVGAAYFDATCTRQVDPNVVGAGRPDFGIGTTVAATYGGNLIALTAAEPAVPPADNLHLYWDGAAVSEAMRLAGVAGAEQDFAKLIAAAPPDGWQTSGPIKEWARQWADEIMPLAVEAHARLSIRKREEPATPGHAPRCGWETTLDPAYQAWASEQARIQLAKAGFRLAALIDAIFRP